MTLISRLVFPIKRKTPQKTSENIQIEDISVVIPVKDNQEGINQYITALAQLSTPLPREVIIVDNDSDKPITVPVDDIQGMAVRLLSCKTPGPAAARNCGARKAHGSWILFNDSDCIPTESTFQGFMSARPGALAYAGNVKALHSDLVSKYYESQEILLPLKTILDDGSHVPQYLVTANALIWKPAFDSLNGFNEEIAIAGGEDVDLGLRLSEIGRLEYAMESVVYHDFSDGIHGFWNRFKRYGRGNRMVEEIWGVSMKPFRFAPNEKSPLNWALAWLQFLSLYIGYTYP